MLGCVGFVDQWREIERGLPGRWGETRLALAVRQPGQADRAAAMLGPLAPGRSAGRFHLTVGRRTGTSPGALERALHRLDEEGLRGGLELVGTTDAPVPAPEAEDGLAEAWDEALAGLPADWSHLHGQVDLTSTDHLERGALLLSPINPSRFDDSPSFRFRCARAAGYGASPGMARRCFERLDEDSIRASVAVLRLVSDSDAAGTQGPVWYVDGKVV